jgi:thioesterase domain-containing protein
MAKEKQKKQLYQLIAGSPAIQSLEAEERLEMQGKILALPDPEKQKIILILRDEQAGIKARQEYAEKEEKEVKKLTGMAQSLREACRTLDKVFRDAMESEERTETGRITDSLLNQIDKL